MRHRHVWGSLWSHYGQYGPQDKHVHVCLNFDCAALLVGPGRDCDGTNGTHKIDRPKPERVVSRDACSK